MSSNEPIKRLEDTTPPSRLQILMEKVLRMRRRENWINAGKFLLIFFVLVLLTALVMGLFRTMDSVDIFWSVILLLLVFGPVILLPALLCQCVLFFWPFLLYFWAGLWTVRRRTLLSLVQASVETQTPLADMIRAYACDCYSSHFRIRLERFAAVLEQGYSLDQAIEWDRGLFSYDVVGMLRLGGDDPATLQSMEDSAQEERNDSPIRSMSIVRVAYFFALVAPLLLVFSFLVYVVIPKFEMIFKDFDTELPGLTVLAIVVSNYFIRYWYLISPIVPFVALLFIVFLIMQTNVVVWRPPFFRRMFRDTDSSKLLRTLAVGLKHNVPIPNILQVYRHLVPSSYLQRKAFRMEKNVADGRDWIESLKKQGMLNGPEAALLETACRTGNTVAVLEQLAVSKERSQLRKDDLTSKLVFIPCLLGLGLVIGIFVIAMFLPLITLTCSLSASI